MNNPFDESQRRYARDWTLGNASHFTSNNYYEWMAAFIKDRHLILEIGTGTGSGTIALCKNGSVVVSLDHNPHFLDIAANNLAAAGIAVTSQKRSKFNPGSVGRLVLSYAPVMASIPESGTVLIDADILGDQAILNWLLNGKKFDAVACWNIGTHIAETMQYKSMQTYRMTVQNRVYEVAHRCLKPGGVLHIVDRAFAPTSSNDEISIKELTANHTEQASVTDLVLDRNIQHLVYEKPPEGSRIIMTPADKTKEFKPDSSLAFWSVIARKP